MRKADIRQSVSDGALSRRVSYELIPQAIRLFGDIAVVHCSYELQGRDAEGREASRAGRLTHTWRRHDGKWRRRRHELTPQRMNGRPVSNSRRLRP